ncbi:TPA: hypothetical protein HA235_02680 [Candidatus Woesearchaeota archaeon]|nr:hypothetical protein [Candidatus Woesearchaeota archaeon]HIH55275.1 hypothetical protein [Candidatus Woesearchaeota archaeon]HIJ02424.1 hypothetical protein [Candidatus Woesearchaeota archaeon]HIJ13301.1 hypothetical protein [Candidatus Woesearchaeota archaeon]
MTTFTNKTGLQILEFISNLKINYGKNNLSKIVWHELGEFTIQQAKDLLSQLIEKGYLKEVNVGISFAMVVVALTEKGREAVITKETISLDFQRFYSTTYKPATDVGIVDKDTLEEYYNIKRELMALQKREEELKETIKQAMIEKHADTITNELMDLCLKKIEKITYPKENIERLVPQDLLEKIRTIKEIIVLTTKLKTIEGMDP